MQKTATSRSFGLLLAAISLGLAALSYWAHGDAYIYWSLISAVFFLISLVMPRVLAPLKRLWFRLAKVLHFIVNPVVLGTVYLLVFVPAGALIRLFRKDPLALKRDPAARSYWIGREAGGVTCDSLRDQF